MQATKVREKPSIKTIFLGPGHVLAQQWVRGLLPLTPSPGNGLTIYTWCWSTNTYCCSLQGRQSESDFASDLENLKKQNRELKEENELLNSKTVTLQLRIDDLLEELSKKEAEWCSKEEKLILEVQPNAETLLLDTRLILTPHYFGQFALSLAKETLTVSLNSTRLIQTLSMAP